jgi:hypothetical protein
MRDAEHICQQQKGLGDRDRQLQPTFVPHPAPKTVTLSCTSWNAGRKVNIKLSFSDAAEKTTG